MKRRYRVPALILPTLLLILLAAGCGALSKPQGWAAPVVTPQGASVPGVLTSFHAGKLTLTNTTTKQAIWQFPLDAKSGAPPPPSLKGIYSTPVISGDTVVFGAYNGHVYALKLADGTEIWDYSTGASIVGGVAVSGDVTLPAACAGSSGGSGKLVVVGNSDGNLYALNFAGDAAAKTTKKCWQHHTGDRIWSTPALDNGVAYVTSLDRKVYAWKLDDGSSVWTNKSSDGAIAASPAIGDGRLYVGSFDKHEYALDEATGNQVWRSPMLQNWVWARADISGGRVYTGTLDGTVYALDSSNGQVVWSRKLGKNAVRSGPIIAQGVLVAANRDGVVEGYDPTTGNPVWPQPATLSSTTLGNLVLSGDGNSVLTVTEGGSGGSRLVSIDPKTGAVTVLATP